MTIINIGSINIDLIYRTPHLVLPGETITSLSHQRGLGGKGMNQSIALHRAGAVVVHVGAIGANDDWTLTQIDTGITQDAIARCDQSTGHAMIELSAAGENRIILYPGANHQLTVSMIEQALASHPNAKYLLLQNETNVVADAISLGHAAGKTVVFNPAPCDTPLRDLPLAQVDILIVNEIELQQLAGVDGIDTAMSALRQRYPRTALIITLGAAGVRYADMTQQLTLPAAPVDEVVDTTGAGDTFIGYCLAGLAAGQSTEQALRQGIKAAAITISRVGAASAIPTALEVTESSL